MPASQSSTCTRYQAFSQCMDVSPIPIQRQYSFRRSSKAFGRTRWTTITQRSPRLRWRTTCPQQSQRSETESHSILSNMNPIRRQQSFRYVIPSFSNSDLNLKDDPFPESCALLPSSILPLIHSSIHSLYVHACIYSFIYSFISFATGRTSIIHATT